MGVLSYLVLAYFVLGFLCWSFVLYVSRNATISFALKSGFLLLLFWPPFIYRAVKRTFVTKTDESSC